MSSRLSERPIYDLPQVSQYFEHIGLSPDLLTSPSTKPSLALLTTLQTHHLLTIPFEDLSLHYSPTPLTPPSLESEDLFDKIVTRGHGGYCMESNCFFATVLRSLGFDVLSVGGRVSEVAMGSRVPVDDVAYGGW